MQERIEGLRKSVAGVGQRLVAPKNWIGSKSVNLFRVVCDLLDLVLEMNVQLAGHTHLSSPPPPVRWTQTVLRESIVSIKLINSTKSHLRIVLRK